MFFDYHIHSSFSSDSSMTLEEICNQSIKLGLQEIAITDHHDIDYQDPLATFLLDKDEYFLAIDKINEIYSNRLTIKKGVELGIQPHILKECSYFVNNGFDFVIASFHTIQKKDLYNGSFFKKYNQWEAYRTYLKEVLDTIKVYDDFNVIGHLDVIRRYGDFSQVPDLMDDKESHDIIREILVTLIDKAKGIEVNTSGYHFADGLDPLPSKKILKLYSQLGGEILTIGSDSHYTSQLGYKFNETYELLKECGFKYFTTFSRGKPDFHKIP